MISQTMADLLYGRLPKFYVQDDNASPQGKPLYRFLQVLSVGFDAIKQDIDGSLSLLDPEKCPDRYLPFLAQSLGIEFPYDMSSAEQRRFIMSASTLYRQKGTITAFQYLARELTGQQFQATISENRDWVLKTNSTGLKTYHPRQQFGTISSTSSYLPGPHYNKTGFNLFLTANEETQNVNRTYDRLQQIASYFSPAGTKMLSTIVYYLTDTYSHSNLGEAFQFDTLTENYGIEPKTAPNTETYQQDNLNETITEPYTALSKYDDWAFTNVAQFTTNNNMNLMSFPHYQDSIAETGTDVYNSVVGNQEASSESLTETNNDTYNTLTQAVYVENDALTESNGVETKPLLQLYDTAYTNMAQYQTNSTMTLAMLMDYTDNVTETNTDTYNRTTTSNDNNNTDSLTEQSGSDTYNTLATAQDINNSESLTETNGVEKAPFYGMWESAFTNVGQYQTNSSMYTNAGNCVDVITTISTGATQIQLS